MQQVEYDRRQIFDQFGFFFDDVIKKHKTPNAICGYIVMGLSNYLCNREFSSMQQLLDSLNQ